MLGRRSGLPDDGRSRGAPTVESADLRSSREEFLTAELPAGDAGEKYMADHATVLIQALAGLPKGIAVGLRACDGDPAANRDVIVSVPTRPDAITAVSATQAPLSLGPPG